MLCGKFVTSGLNLYQNHQHLSTMMARRQSRAALWCQRLAGFLLPFFLVVIAGHRWQLIDTPSMFGLMGLGLVLIFMALGLGGIGLYQLWHHGHKGGMQSVRGISLGLILLVPFAWFGWLAFTLPPLNDITTDKITPPAYDAAIKFRVGGMNEIDVIPVASLELQGISYPQITSRRYGATNERVFAAVSKLMQARGWTIIAEDIPETIDLIDIEGSARQNTKQLQAIIPTRKPAEIPTNGKTADQLADDEKAADELNITYVEAVARSLIMGFADDIVVRIVEEEQGSLVDMRSSSRWGVHDLGANAARVSQFLGDLDKSLVGIAGEN